MLRGKWLLFQKVNDEVCFVSFCDIFGRYCVVFLIKTPKIFANKKKPLPLYSQNKVNKVKNRLYVLPLYRPND